MHSTSLLGLLKKFRVQNWQNFIPYASAYAFGWRPNFLEWELRLWPNTLIQILKIELFIGINQLSFVALNLKLQNWYCCNFNFFGQFTKNLDTFEEFTWFHDFAKKVMWLMYVTKAKPFTLIPHQNQKPIKGAKKCTKEKWKTHTWNSK